MKGLKLITLAVVATTATFANAGVKELKPASVSAEVGSLGYGAKVAWDVNDTTELQVGINGGDVTDMIPCNCEKQRQISDVMKNALTVGAGVMHVGSDKLNFVSTKTANDRKVVAGKKNRQYTVKGGAKVEGTIKFENSFAPYLTVGVHPNKDKKVSVFGEVGAVYVGGVKTDVTTKGKYLVNGQEVKSNDPKYANEIAQLEDDLRQEVKDRVDRNVRSKDKFYPVAKVGATVRF